MALFYNPRTKVLVSVADNFDRSSWVPWWVRIPEEGQPTTPLPAGVTAEEWAATLRTATDLRQWDAAKAAREAVELAADARPMAEARDRAKAEADERRRADAEKERLMRVEFEKVAAVNQQARLQAAH